MPAMNLARHRLSNALEQRGIHFGWVMVALAFVNALFATSAVGVPSVLIVPMAEDLGWSIGRLNRAAHGFIWVVCALRRGFNDALWATLYGGSVRHTINHWLSIIHHHDPKVATLARYGVPIRDRPQPYCNVTGFCCRITLVHRQARTGAGYYDGCNGHGFVDIYASCIHD